MGWDPITQYLGQYKIYDQFLQKAKILPLLAQRLFPCMLHSHRSLDAHFTLRPCTYVLYLILAYLIPLQTHGTYGSYYMYVG
jgi:hypothetical protein